MPIKYSITYKEFTTQRAPLINQYFYQPDPKEPEEDAEPRVAFSNMQFVCFGLQLDTESHLEINIL